MAVATYREGGFMKTLTITVLSLALSACATH